MQNWKPDVSLVVRVPTYYGARDLIAGAKLGRDEACYEGNKKEFDGWAVPVLIYHAKGMKLILGSERADVSPYAKPNMAYADVQIEPRSRGWAIFCFTLKLVATQRASSIFTTMAAAR